MYLNDAPSTFFEKINLLSLFISDYNTHTFALTSKLKLRNSVNFLRTTYFMENGKFLLGCRIIFPQYVQVNMIPFSLDQLATQIDATLNNGQVLSGKTQQ